MNNEIILWTIIAILFAGAAKGVMDTHAFWWYNSIFNRDTKDTAFGRWWKRFTSEHAWKNKYMYEKIMGWLMRNTLSWTTDIWHLSQLVFLTILQVLIAIHFATDFWGVVFWVGVMKLVQAAAFDLTRFLLEKDTYINYKAMMAPTKRIVSSVLIVYSRGIAIGVFVSSFMIGLFIASRGLYTDYWTPRYTASLLVVLAGAAIGGWVIWFGGNRR